MEKYIYHFTSDRQNNEKKLNIKLINELPLSLQKTGVKIVNPQGILVLGRDNLFANNQQRQDFEIVRRQYKNVTIMTYDDLLNQLRNIIAGLKQLV